MAERYEAVEAFDDEQPEPRAIGKREALYALGGVLVGLLILGVVWWRTGRNTTPLPTLSQVQPYAAPAFTAKDLDGGTITLADWRGKVVLLNFWASWCVPCKEETPELEAIYQQLKDQGLVIVGIDLFKTERLDTGMTDVRDFVAQYGVTYPVGIDESGDIAKSYAVSPIPTSYFIDQQGRVRFVRVGKLSKQDVERVFRRLQAEQPASNGSR